MVRARCWWRASASGSRAIADPRLIVGVVATCKNRDAVAAPGQCRSLTPTASRAISAVFRRRLPWRCRMEATPDVAGRIERRLGALGLRPEQVDAEVGLPLGTTERGAVRGLFPGAAFFGACARR